MPVHALAGHLAIITAPLTAVIALLYAWRPSVRAWLRLPLVGVAVLNFVLAAWAATAGSALLHQLRAASQAAGRPLTGLALAHADQGDYLTTAALVLLALVLTFAWWRLSPRHPRLRATPVPLTLVTLAAVAVLWYTATTFIVATDAVWSQHPFWTV